MKILRYGSGLVATMALFLMITAPAVIAADPVYATVTGYAAGTAANNHASTWGKDCVKIVDGGSLTSYVLTADYSLVIVKAGSERANAGHVNTLFADASAGETVWADTNGNGVFDPGGRHGDKAISHIIVCPAEAQPTPSQPTPTPSQPTPTPSQPTPTPSQPTPTPSQASEQPSQSAPDTGGSGPTPPPTDTAVSPVAQAESSPFLAIVFVLAVAGIALSFAAPKSQRR